MAILIRGGTVVDAERTYRADVLCADPQDGGTILQIAEKIDAPAVRRSSMRTTST
jgi:dihydropyrimidinase